MSKTALAFSVEPRADLAERVRQDLTRQGWEVEMLGNELVAREDATRLCCIESPARVSLWFQEGPGETVVEVEASVPGFGPVSRRNVRSRLACAARAVLRSASATPRTP